MIALLSNCPGDQLGVCLNGKWQGWLMTRHSDGNWVTVRKLDTVDPYEGNPFAAMFGGPIKGTPDAHKPHPFQASTVPLKCIVCGLEGAHHFHAVTVVGAKMT